MELLTATKDDIFNIFNSGLEKGIISEEARSYVSNLMTSMVFSTINFDETEAVSIQLLKANRNDEITKFAVFRDIADSLLFLCGFFPERFVNAYKRRPIGLEYYLQQGEVAYHGAGKILEKRRIQKPNPGLMFNLSTHFIPYTAAVFNLRNELDERMTPNDENILEAIYKATKNNMLLRIKDNPSLLKHLDFSGKYLH